MKAASWAAAIGGAGRRHGAIIAVLVALAGVYYPFTWSEWLSLTQDDGAIYVLTARHYAPGLPADPAAAWFAADSMFPPLYPAILAITGGGASVAWAHLATTTLLLASLAALYAWLRVLGAGRGLAAAVAGLFGVLPGTYTLALGIFSEPLFAALSLAACAIFARPAASTRSSAIAIALVAAALLTRTAAVALVPALALHLWRRHGWRGLAALPIGLAPALLWGFVHEPPQTASYGALTLAFWRHAWPDAPNLLAYHGTSFALGLAQALFVSTAYLWLAVAMGCVAIAAAAVRFLRLEPDAWYLAAYCAMFLLWPYSQETRYGWIALPILLGHALWSLLRLAQGLQLRAPAARWLPAAAVGAVAVAAVPGLALAAERWRDPVAVADPEYRHVPEWYQPRFDDALRDTALQVALERSLRGLGTRVPPGECVYASIDRSVAALSGRLALQTPRPQLDDAEFERQIAASGACRWFLLVNGVRPQYPVPFYPAQRLGGRLHIVETVTARVGNEEIVVAELAEVRR